METAGPPLRGREGHILALGRAWREALAGSGRAVCLVGPHGAGRTALLAALADLVRRETPGARVVKLSPLPATAGALGLVASLLARGLGLDPAIPEPLETRLAALTGSHGDALAYEVSLMSLLFGLDGRRRLDAPGDPQAAALRFATDLVLADARKTPLLLIADDVSQADPVSAEWVAGLVAAARREGAPIMLAGSVLDTRQADVARLEAACEATPLLLEPLDHPAAIQVLADRTETTLAGDLLAAALEAAGGSPAALAAIGDGLLRGEWKPGATWRDLAMQGLAALPEPARALIDAAAVVGGPLDLETLAAVAGVADGAAALSGAPQLYPDPAGVWFRESAIRDLAGDLLAPARRSMLHQRAGDHLERHAPRFAALHHERAGNRAGLLRALTNAAEAARNRSDLEDARDLLLRAIDGADPDQVPAEPILTLGDLLVNLGSYDAAIGLLARHTVRMTGAARSRALRTTGRALERKGEYPAAKAHHLEGLADPDLPAEQRTGLLADLAVILVRQGEYAEARRRAEEAIDANAEGAAGLELALACSVLGICHYRQGRFEEALQAHGQALELRERAGDLAGVASTLNNLGNVLSDSGNWDAALETFGRALALAEIAGDARTRTALHNNVAAVHLQRKDFPSAEAACHASLAAKTQAGETPGIGIALATMAAVDAGQGRLDAALARAEEAIGLLEGLGEREILADVRAAHGEILMRRGAFDAAWASLQRGLDLAEETGKATVVARLYRLYSELCQREGRLRESLAFAREAVFLNRQHRRPIELARSLRQLARAGGDPDGAAAREAADLLAGLGVSPGDDLASR
ncbi:MAG: tetratricopeptide repeat protein [Candidatus Sericytochromatia bacterium]|nr:tetratricopeptide repeat protein [Candidatus Tanganyikabacteria bacterium]